MRVWSLSQEDLLDPLQYSCLENPWTEEPGRLQSMGSQRVGHDWSNSAPMHACMGGYELTSADMNQPLHFPKQECWSTFTRQQLCLAFFICHFVSPLERLFEIHITVSFYILKSWRLARSWNSSHVTQEVAESAFKQRHIQLQTCHYSSSILPPLSELLQCVHVDRRLSWQLRMVCSLRWSFRESALNIIFKSKHRFIAKRCYRKCLHLENESYLCLFTLPFQSVPALSCFLHVGKWGLGCELCFLKLQLLREDKSHWTWLSDSLLLSGPQSQ